jgi:hypothetical protein
VRKAGATARTMLIQAAANEWKVPATEFLATDEGTRVPLRKAPQGGASSGTSSQARAQSSAGMAELGRRKGKAPVVTKAWTGARLGFAIASYAPYALSATLRL